MAEIDTCDYLAVGHQQQLVSCQKVRQDETLAIPLYDFVRGVRNGFKTLKLLDLLNNGWLGMKFGVGPSRHHGSNLVPQAFRCRVSDVAEKQNSYPGAKNQH